MIFKKVALLINACFMFTFANCRPSPSNNARDFLIPQRTERATSKPSTRILTKPRNFTFSPDRIGSASEQDIVFPDSYEDVHQSVIRIDRAPNCAIDSTFCEEIASYPYQHVKEILKEGQLSPVLFGKEEAPPEIANRHSAAGLEDIFMCGSIDRTIFPKIGKTKNNKWKYIINQGERDGYVQGVLVETCRHQGRPCELSESFPSAYKTSCKQKYVYRRLISLSEDGRPVVDNFQMPSACCCTYKRNLSFLEDFGARMSPVKT